MQHLQELSTAAIRPERSRYNRPRKNPGKRLKPNKTKNILAFLKSRHRNYLKLYWKKCKTGNIKEDHPILARILFSKGNKIALKDFETIYKMRELSACWISMFQSRYLYHQLMLSRALIEQRLEYNQKMRVFEEAFVAKSFERIR